MGFWRHGKERLAADKRFLRSAPTWCHLPYTVIFGEKYSTASIYSRALCPENKRRREMQRNSEGCVLKKNSLKYLIDAALFVDISSMVAVGFLLAFVIPRGGGRAFSGYFLGLYRHQWTDVHLFLSLFLVPLLFVHIWLSWTWVVQSSKRYIGDRWKTFLWALCAAWILVLILGWTAARF